MFDSALEITYAARANYAEPYRLRFGKGPAPLNMGSPFLSTGVSVKLSA